MYTYAYTYFALHYICDGHSNLLFWTLGWAGMNVRWLCGQTSDLLVAFHFMDCTKQWNATQIFHCHSEYFRIYRLSDRLVADYLRFSTNVSEMFSGFTMLSFIWMVVWNMNFIFPFSWESHPPNWWSHIFQRTTNQWYDHIIPSGNLT